MSLTLDNVKKIGILARINLSEDDMAFYAPQLSTILSLVEQMDRVDTALVEPMANALDLSQRLRPDAVTETDQREAFQAIAPQVEAGLYLVPKVIDDESTG